MDQPKQNKKKKITVKPAGTGNLNGELYGNLKRTPEEMARDAKVAKSVKDPEYIAQKKKEGVNISEGGIASPKLMQPRKIVENKRGSGQTNKIYRADGSLVGEAEPGSREWEELKRKSRNQVNVANRGRTRTSEVMNFQTGDEYGNRVHDSKLGQQVKRNNENIQVRIKQAKKNANKK
jgi:hypothetical protein